tara:strand:- start:2372 stop:3544 length:1173 start_codon:yes stop_codon:yes gene_type:complete
MEKNIIDLWEFVEDSWSVILKDAFRNSLKSEIKKFKFQKDISSRAGISIESLRNFLRGRYCMSIGTLKCIQEILHIPQKTLIKNIEKICIKSRKNGISPSNIQIDSFFSEWYGLWMGEGDHSTTREAISMTNYCTDILLTHLKMLKRLQIPPVNIKVEIITNTKDRIQRIRNRWAIILDIPKDQISYVGYMSNATEEGARVQVWSAPLFRLLHKAEPIIKDYIKKSRNLSISYIKGIFAAEGNIRKDKKTIRLGMKRQLEVLYIQNLLGQMGIKTPKLYFNPNNKAYELRIFGYENLSKFQAINGFGKQSKRGAILDETLDSYERFTSKTMLNKITAHLLKEKELTNNQLAKYLNRHSRWMATISKNLTKKRILQVNTHEKAYKYSLNTN